MGNFSCPIKVPRDRLRQTFFFLERSNAKKMPSISVLGVFMFYINTVTGKYFSKALILASNNPQYDKRLISELPVQYMKIPRSEHGENMGEHEENRLFT